MRALRDIINYHNDLQYEYTNTFLFFCNPFDINFRFMGTTRIVRLSIIDDLMDKARNETFKKPNM